MSDNRLEIVQMDDTVLNESFWQVMGIVDIMRIIQEYVDLREFFAISKTLIETKRHVLYWKLNVAASVRYYEDVEFQRVIREKVVNVSKQLNLHFRDCDKITDVSALGNVHTLDLSRCDKVTDVSALGNVHTLTLSHCAS